MKVITVKGFKKTGKTTTCTRLIEELRSRGYTVGSLKSTHFPGFAIDTPDTDSWRHAKAGASTVVIIGNEETDIVMKRHVDLPDLIHMYQEDFLVCEGDTGMDFASIVTGKSVQDLEERRDEHTIGFAGIISSELTEHDGLPVIDATRDIAALADLVEANCSTWPQTDAGRRATE